MRALRLIAISTENNQKGIFTPYFITYEFPLTYAMSLFSLCGTTLNIIEPSSEIRDMFKVSSQTHQKSIGK